MFKRLKEWFSPADQLISPVAVAVRPVDGGVLVQFFVSETEDIAIVLSFRDTTALMDLMDGALMKGGCRSVGVIPGEPGPPVIH